jgi:hypothetical protein
VGASTETIALFPFGTLPAMLVAWTQSWALTTKKGVFQMTISIRQTASAFAAAILTSLVFVSSTVSALPIA